jgi:ParB-like chromosome segregation protein Spo0J
MIIYTKLPIADIKYTDRPELHKEEIKFKTALINSIKKHGIIDPIYAEVGNDYGRYIKVIVGNNRMAVAKE